MKKEHITAYELIKELTNELHIALCKYGRIPSENATLQNANKYIEALESFSENYEGEAREAFLESAPTLLRPQAE